MKTKTLKMSGLILAAAFALSFDTPKGWFPAGSEPKSYEMGIEKGAGRDGKNAATIKSAEKKIHGFGTLMQQSSPGRFLGKRVRMTGYVKSADVDKWAGLWFRVDGPDPKRSLSFDNMHDRAIRGTTEWKKYEIILDVPSNATGLAYGALLVGKGQIWFDDINMDIVDEAAKVTGSDKFTMDEPTNLDFEN